MKPRGIDPTTDQIKVGDHWIPAPSAMARIFHARWPQADYERWDTYSYRVLEALDRLEGKRIAKEKAHDPR